MAWHCCLWFAHGICDHLSRQNKPFLGHACSLPCRLLLKKAIHPQHWDTCHHHHAFPTMPCHSCHFACIYMTLCVAFTSSQVLWTEHHTFVAACAGLPAAVLFLSSTPHTTLVHLDCFFTPVQRGKERHVSGTCSGEAVTVTPSSAVVAYASAFCLYFVCVTGS